MIDEGMIEQFSAKYHEGSDWGGHSGGGSVPYYALAYRSFLEKFIYMNQLGTVVDVGCGDWQFSRFVNYYPAKYHGYDIIGPVIDRNRARYESDDVQFSIMPDNLDAIGGGDLLIIKDVLQHLPDNMIMTYRDKLLPKFRFCLLTNSFNKLGAHHNVDIDIGQFRSLDLTRSPYEVRGSYVASYMSPLWEEIRTLLICRTC